MKIITFKVKEVEAPWTKLARSYRGWRNRRRQREQALKIAYEGAWAAARMGCQLPDLDALGFTEKQRPGLSAGSVGLPSATLGRTASSSRGLTPGVTPGSARSYGIPTLAATP